MKSNISLGFPSVKTKETKKEMKQKTLSFIKLDQIFKKNFKKFKLRQNDHDSACRDFDVGGVGL